MLKIALGITIAACLAGLYGTVGISTKIADLNTANAALTKAKGDAEAAQKVSAGEAKKAQAAEAKATKELASVTVARDQKTQEADSQTKRANALTEQLNKANEDRTKAQQKLAQWDALGVTPEQIKILREDLRKAVEVAGNYAMTNKNLSRELKVTKDELNHYRGPDQKVRLPEGLRGKIVAVDSKLGFVVLDIGSDSSLKPAVGGEMLVTRDGRLVGKLRLTSVQPTQTIANILPEFSQAGAEVMEGDVAVRSNL